MSQTRIVRKQKHIALVAHDHKKQELIDWSIENKDKLSKHILYATGTTGKLIEEALDQPVTRFLSGPLGGDQEIGASIATGAIDVMVFFSDPMEMQPHDSDVRALLRLGNAWNIIIANNRSSADFIFSSPFMDSEYTIEIPDYSAYLHRTIKGED